MQKKEEKNIINNTEMLKEIKIVYEHIEKMLDNIEYNDFINNFKLNSIKGELRDLYTKNYENIEKNNKDKLLTSACCKNCSNNLLISDNIDYSYQCNECDENFYDFEVISNDVWYNKEEKVMKEIPSSFEIQIDYEKEEEMLYIGTECSSGLKYKCKNVNDLSKILENYCDNLMLDLEEMEKEI